MSKIIILGSSNAIPHAEHENTHMLIVGTERVVLVDCSGNPTLRLQRAGVKINAITDLILTHFHPDHVSGAPLLLMHMWLLGRREPLNIYGLEYTLDRLESMMGLFNWDKWPGFYPVTFNRLPEVEMTRVLTCPDFSIYASPVKHLIPTIGLRVDFESQKAFAYSCDTEPCEQVVRLASGVDVLFHEASGVGTGHSSAAQAGEIAARAEAGHLYLIHYPNGKFRKSDLVTEARASYQGEVSMAEDFITLDF